MLSVRPSFLLVSPTLHSLLLQGRETASNRRRRILLKDIRPGVYFHLSSGSNKSQEGP